MVLDVGVPGDHGGVLVGYISGELWTFGHTVIMTVQQTFLNRNAILKLNTP